MHWRSSVCLSGPVARASLSRLDHHRDVDVCHSHAVFIGGHTWIRPERATEAVLLRISGSYCTFILQVAFLGSHDAAGPTWGSHGALWLEWAAPDGAPDRVSSAHCWTRAWTPSSHGSPVKLDADESQPGSHGDSSPGISSIDSWRPVVVCLTFVGQSPSG